MSTILAIETSCDETAAAVVTDGRTILSNVVASQIELHRRYGGVFPEVASRQHVLSITPVIEQALAEAAVDWTDLDAVAVTEGPGLAGSLLVGVNAAKGITFMRNLPLIGVNHLEGHIYSNWLRPEITPAGQGSFEGPGEQDKSVNTPALTIDNSSFPVLILIVSGGHTELILMEDHGRYRRLGGTLDDAAGEAFDKVARLLGLSYPGGPVIQRVAVGGDSAAFDLPRALTNRPEHRYNFSFSGLKTAVLRLVREQQILLDDQAWPEAYAESAGDAGTQGRGDAGTRGRGDAGTRGHGDAETREPDDDTARAVQMIRDVAASFQLAVADALVSKTLSAARHFEVKHINVCGGVAANLELRRRLANAVSHSDYPCPEVSVPPVWLCTDNAAMIGAAGHYRWNAGLVSGWDLDVQARLPLRSWN
ncbi:MAG: tRNA (adenosine(37)-N6)-threonylcarbamoyltransferase complex transferase subunit TsaD [Chloroflexota bacterium]|nr:tRNA (adenosine(37)-N6)-threonylcarbamoyltransferase complex transferase subunit TsaD [Chloroflexota bacterium]